MARTSPIDAVKGLAPSGLAPRDLAPRGLANAGTPSRRGVLVGSLMLPSAIMACVRTPARLPPSVELHVSSDGDFLAFKPDVLTCPAGARVRLIFHHAGKYVTQEHDWVLVEPGTAQAVDRAAEQAGERNGWTPTGDRRILAATRMCGRGGAVMVDFIAPPPGEYPFLCTFPGHGADMHGLLRVTA